MSTIFMVHICVFVYLQLHTRESVILIIMQWREQRATTAGELTKNESKGEEWRCASINVNEWIEHFPYKLNFTFYQSIERGRSAHLSRWTNRRRIKRSDLTIKKCCSYLSYLFNKHF